MESYLNTCWKGNPIKAVKLSLWPRVSRAWTMKSSLCYRLQVEAHWIQASFHCQPFRLCLTNWLMCEHVRWCVMFCVRCETCKFKMNLWKSFNKASFQIFPYRKTKNVWVVPKDMYETIFQIKNKWQKWLHDSIKS